MDIIVPRKDYKKLMLCLKEELPEDYWLQNFDTDEHYWLSFSKVRKKGTLYKEKALKNMDDRKCGIWIDIFPLDNAPKNSGLKLRIRKFAVRTISFALRIRELRESICAFSRRYIPILIFWRLFPSKMLKKIQCYFMEKIEPAVSEYYVCLETPYPIEKESYPVAWFDSSKELLFEDRMFLVPSEYHAFLTQLYGDYMTPPPESQRGGHNVDELSTIVV